MKKLGTPTKDGEKWYQQWYPEPGDIRPEGLEFRVKGGRWESSGLCGTAFGTEREFNEYRIPSKYIPPSGWYCVGDDETVMEGDRYHIDDRQGDIGNGHYGCIVSKFRDAFGGWVLRREPVGFPEVTAANVAAVLHEPYESQGGPSTAQSSHAQPVAAPVAWQFRKRPMERNVDHWLSLVAGKDTIQEGDERWTHVESRWKPWTVFFGEVLEDECPCRRPVYAPLPTRLEDVPDGRVIRDISYRPFTITDIEAAHFFKWSGKIVHWEVVNGFVSLTDTDISYRPFTITDHVAELRPIE